MAVRTRQGESDYISPAEAARMLGVDPKTLTRWSEAGKVASIRPNVHRRYLRTDIEALRTRSAS